MWYVICFAAGAILAFIASRYFDSKLDKIQEQLEALIPKK